MSFSASFSNFSNFSRGLYSSFITSPVLYEKGSNLLLYSVLKLLHE